MLVKVTCDAVGLFSKRVLKEETLPVTTGEGDRFLKLNLFPVPVRPRKPLLISTAGSVLSTPGIDNWRFLSLRSGEGLRVFENGVVHRGLGPVRVTGIRDSAVRCSKRSLVLVTEPWFARAKIRRGFGLLVLLGGSVWGKDWSTGCKCNSKKKPASATQEYFITIGITKPSKLSICTLIIFGLGD